MSDADTQMIEKLRARLKRMRRFAGKERGRGEAHGFLDGVIATLKPGDLVVDCGANVGDVTKRIAASGADVVAFEPDPWTFEELEKGTEDLPNVSRINAGVGAEAGEFMLYRSATFSDDPRVESVNSSIMAEARSVDNEAEGIPVTVIDFPDWLEERIEEGRNIALIKIDIEGAEIDLLEEMIARDLPTHTGPILVETHEWLFPKERPRYAALREQSGRYPFGRINLDWV